MDIRQPKIVENFFDPLQRSYVTEADRQRVPRRSSGLERLLLVQEVRGSNPVLGTHFFRENKFKFNRGQQTNSWK